MTINKSSEEGLMVERSCREQAPGEEATPVKGTGVSKDTGEHHQPRPGAGEQSLAWARGLFKGSRAHQVPPPFLTLCWVAHEILRTTKRILISEKTTTFTKPCVSVRSLPLRFLEGKRSSASKG